MTEVPKCPYCGAELEVTHAFVSNATETHKMVYTCFCRECGVYTPKRSTPEEALSAAIHRAEPEMRPLTMEEVKSHCAKGQDAKPLYIEFSRRTTLSRWILVSPNIECNEPATVTRYLDIWEHDYGKTWRCWPRKPTPKQMAVVEWEE